jgi:hypothetical protein
VSVHVASPPKADVSADDGLLRLAVSALASAVVQAQANDSRVVIAARTTPHDGRPGVSIDIAPVDVLEAQRTERSVDVLRGGLGLSLPLAMFIIAAHGGHALEQHIDDRFGGIRIWLPTA